MDGITTEGTEDTKGGIKEATITSKSSKLVGGIWNYKEEEVSLTETNWV